MWRPTRPVRSCRAHYNFFAVMGKMAYHKQFCKAIFVICSAQIVLNNNKHSDTDSAKLKFQQNNDKPYTGKFWRLLNLAEWPGIHIFKFTGFFIWRIADLERIAYSFELRKLILANFKFGGRAIFPQIAKLKQSPKFPSIRMSNDYSLTYTDSSNIPTTILFVFISCPEH